MWHKNLAVQLFHQGVINFMEDEEVGNGTLIDVTN